MAHELVLPPFGSWLLPGTSLHNVAHVLRPDVLEWLHYWSAERAAERAARAEASLSWNIIAAVAMQQHAAHERARNMISRILREAGAEHVKHTASETPKMLSGSAPADDLGADASPDEFSVAKKSLHPSAATRRRRGQDVQHAPSGERAGSLSPSSSFSSAASGKPEVHGSNNAVLATEQGAGGSRAAPLDAGVGVCPEAAPKQKRPCTKWPPSQRGESGRPAKSAEGSIIATPLGDSRETSVDEEDLEQASLLASLFNDTRGGHDDSPAAVLTEENKEWAALTTWIRMNLHQRRTAKRKVLFVGHHPKHNPVPGVKPREFVDEEKDCSGGIAGRKRKASKRGVDGFTFTLNPELDWSDVNHHTRERMKTLVEETKRVFTKKYKKREPWEWTCKLQAYRPDSGEGKTFLVPLRDVVRGIQEVFFEHETLCEAGERHDTPLTSCEN